MLDPKNVTLRSLHGNEVRLDFVIEHLNAKIATYYKNIYGYPDMEAGSYPQLVPEFGSKYIRLVNHRFGKNDGVYCFLDYEGNIYKSASYKAPAKHIRGSVFDPDMSWNKGLGPYGAKYL